MSRRGRCVGIAGRIMLSGRTSIQPKSPLHLHVQFIAIFGRELEELIDGQAGKLCSSHVVDRR